MDILDDFINFTSTSFNSCYVSHFKNRMRSTNTNRKRKDTDRNPKYNSLKVLVNKCDSNNFDI